MAKLLLGERQRDEDHSLLGVPEERKHDFSSELQDKRSKWLDDGRKLRRRVVPLQAYEAMGLLSPFVAGKSSLSLAVAKTGESCYNSACYED